MRVLFVILLMVSSPVSAQEVSVRFQLFVDAIEVAAQADAYNGYCGKDTQMGDDLVARAMAAGLMNDDGGALRGFQQEHYLYFAQALKDEGVDCKNVEFLLGKLEVFKKLKGLMGRVNGDVEGGE